MNLSRRELFQRSAGAIILGFPFLSLGCFRWKSAAGPEEPLPDFLALARERMSREAKPGVILVVPDNEVAAVRLAGQLTLLLQDSPNGCVPPPPEPVGVPPGIPHLTVTPPRHLFCQAVFVCLPLDRVQEVYPEANSETACVLLGLDGQPIDSLKKEPMLFEGGFSQKMTDLLHGKKKERLQIWASAQQEALEPYQREQIEVAIRDLSAPDEVTRRTALDIMKSLAPRSTARLALAANSSPRVRGQVERLFDEVYTSAPLSEPGSRQPLGTQWEEPTPVKHDPCPACGMAMAPDTSRRFLRFLSAKK